jgi:hypothetical protein
VRQLGKEGRRVALEWRPRGERADQFARLDESVTAHAHGLGNDGQEMSEDLVDVRSMGRGNAEVWMDSELEQVAVGPQDIERRTFVRDEPGRANAPAAELLRDRLDHEVGRPVHVEGEDELVHASSSTASPKPPRPKSLPL